MSSVRFVTVDVFTKERYTGNQLAIVHLPTAGLTQEQKQTIAKEFNYSETTFVRPANESEAANDHAWVVDIFTLDQELPFAGHPTIGTAVHLLEGTPKSDSAIVRGTFILKAGPVALEYDPARRIARAGIPHNVHIHRALCSSAEMMKLQPKLGRVPSQSPVVSIVNGMTFVLVELDSQDSLTFVNTTSHKLEMQLDDGKTESFIGCYFYYRMSKSEDGLIRLRTRMIESSVGEDAATGSAACTLACYLTIQSRVAGSTSRYLLTQGVEMGRRSDIGVDVKTTADARIETVTLSGSAVQVMEGQLKV